MGEDSKRNWTNEEGEAMNWYAILFSRDLKIFMLNTFEYNYQKEAFVKALINKGRNILTIDYKQCNRFYKKNFKGFR